MSTRNVDQPLNKNPMQKVNQPLSLLEPVTFSELCEAFLMARQAQGVSQKTLRAYRQELVYFCRFLSMNSLHNITDVTAPVVRIYLDQLKTHRNAGGRNIAYRVLKTATYWWEDETDGDYKSPMRKVAAPKLDKFLLPPVRPETVRQLVQACEGSYAARDKAIFICLLDTGCRANEFVSIDLADLDMRTGKVTIQHGKGGKQRSVFIGRAGRKAIRAYLKTRQDNHSALWLTDEGERLTYAGLRQIVRRAAERAGIEAPSLHSFRRGFCVGMMRKGINVLTIRTLMGHADLDVLQRYAAQEDADLQAAHDQGSPGDDL